VTKDSAVRDGADASPVGRTYRSPLRERQVAQTRETILRALADEILQNGIHGLSVAAVAARADVAERTVYRHFASGEALVEALTSFVGEQLTAKLGDHLQLRPGTNGQPDDMIDHLPDLYAALDEIGAPARAFAAVTLARGSDSRRRQRRDILADRLKPELAHLDPAAAHATVEVLHLLGGTVSWFLLTRGGELTGRQAGQAAARVARALLQDLRAERAAASGSSR
jgi:AcrR family transcriptional regulator